MASQATYNIIRRMRSACWIPKATNTHSEYAIFIPFPRRQRLRESASMLRLYVHRLPQYNETNVMHFSFNLLRINSLYMFRSLLAHLQTAFGTLGAGHSMSSEPMKKPSQL
jgi:hypothetical protein